MPDPNPIGIFDSGVGGLSVMKNICDMLPAEDIIYFADSAYCPYGNFSSETARNRSLALSKFLISRGAKTLVVACNTASSAVLNELRELYSVPVIGMEPALKPAAKITQNKKVGIMATGVTISGERFNSLVRRFGTDLKVITQPCPGLVELIEEGKAESDRTIELLRQYLKPFKEEKVDTVVLGCTHYPFLTSSIRSILGPEINIIDTGKAVARRVDEVLKENSINTPKNTHGSKEYFTSGDPGKVSTVIQKLLDQENISVIKANI